MFGDCRSSGALRPDSGSTSTCDSVCVQLPSKPRPLRRPGSATKRCVYAASTPRSQPSPPLSGTAYNAGPGTIASALQRVLGRSRGTDADFYAIAPHLPAETREYVPKLIAAARIGKDPRRYGVAVG